MSMELVYTSAPSAANASRFGVRTALFPAQPMQSPRCWSSIRNSTLGFRRPFKSAARASRIVHAPIPAPTAAPAPAFSTCRLDNPLDVPFAFTLASGLLPVVSYFPPMISAITIKWSETLRRVRRAAGLKCFETST